MKNIFLLLIVLAYPYYNYGCEQSVLDIVLVLDASGSILPSDFTLAKNALVNMVSKLNVEPNKIHVGVIQYDNIVRVIKSLIANEQEKNELIAAINAIPYTGGSTATGDALSMAKKLFFNNIRPFTPRICVLFTDGYSNTGMDVLAEAKLLRDAKVDIYAIGIGPYINDQELEGIASFPTTKYKKLINSYASMIAEINQITTTTCDTPAFIDVNQKAVIESVKNEVRNFQTDLTNLKSVHKNNIIELEITNLKGLSLVNWSLSDENGHTIKDTQVEEIEKENADGTKAISYFIFLTPQSKRLYFSVKALSDGENKYEITLTKL